MPETGTDHPLITEHATWYEAARQRLQSLAQEAEASGRHNAYDEVRADYALHAFDRLGELLAALQPALPSRGALAAEVRQCLRCGADLTDVMGVYVFVAGTSMPGSALHQTRQQWRQQSERAGVHAAQLTDDP